MPTEVATRHRLHVHDTLVHDRLVNDVANSISEAEEARLLRRDATAMIERMAVQARTAGLDHPVAASVALAARISELSGPEAFAERTGISIARLVEAEAGAVPFGDLPWGYDPVLAALGVDLLSLADLEAEWAVPEGRTPPG